MSDRIVVLGAGQMGAGIAQVALQAGFQVTLFDSFPNAKERALTGMQKSLEKLHGKGVLPKKAEDYLKQLQFVTELKQMQGMDALLAIEAVPENFEIKAKVFVELDQVLGASTVFASNTSSISITRLASVTKRPQKFAGMHFMNPVPLMKGVELIQGMATSPEAFDVIKQVCIKMGKDFVVANDRPGFAINRVLIPMLNEAFFALEEGIATAEDIDKGMKLGTNQPMGPLTLADFVGLDTLLSICEVLQRELGDDKYRPAPLLRKYVEAGWYGVKSKRGVYRYD